MGIYLWLINGFIKLFKYIGVVCLFMFLIISIILNWKLIVLLFFVIVSVLFLELNIYFESLNFNEFI